MKFETNYIITGQDGVWTTSKISNAHSMGVNAVSWCPALAPGLSLFQSDSSTTKPPLIKRFVAWAPSSGLPQSYIASCSQDRRVIIWSNDGKEDKPWTLRILNTFDDVVWHVSWSVMGNILAVSGGDNKVSLWKENFNGEWICINEIQNKGS